jgi:hypothetical protein
MAVALVAVEMGSRNQRRLMTSVFTLTLVAALSLFGLWMFGGLPFTHSSNQSGSAVQPRHLTLIPDKLVYGMTKQQVRQRVGAPEMVAGGCWQYRENVKNFVGQTINAVRVCFLGNAYSNDYKEIDGKWRDPSSTKLVIAPPTQ